MNGDEPHQAGDMTDWCEIMRQHGPLVLRAGLRLLGNEADTADCFQRTFLSALELARTQKIRNWPGVLKRLATARALEQLRQRFRETSRLCPLPRDPVPDDRMAAPVDVAAAGELAEKLREALAMI